MTTPNNSAQSSLLAFLKMYSMQVLGEITLQPGESAEMKQVQILLYLHNRIFSTFDAQEGDTALILGMKKIHSERYERMLDSFPIGDKLKVVELAINEPKKYQELMFEQVKMMIEETTNIA